MTNQTILDAEGNLREDITEAEVEALSNEVLDLITKQFHTERTKLICNRCGMSVTWVTKHCKERHGDDVTVWQLPQHLGRGELW